MAAEVLTERGKRAPRDIQRRIARAGGWNRFGQPNFRLVWGWDRLQLVGGTPEDPWVDTDDDGNFLREVVGYRWVPKYAMQGLERWHVERWVPPEFCAPSPEVWRRLYEPEMGPYPAYGEYEHCFTLPRAKGFLLTGEVVAFIISAIEHSRAQVAADRAKAKQALEEVVTQKQKHWQEFADGVTEEAMSRFNGPAITVPELPF